MFENGTCENKCEIKQDSPIMGAKCGNDSHLSDNEECDMTCDNDYYDTQSAKYICRGGKLEHKTGGTLDREKKKCPPLASSPSPIPKDSVLIFQNLTKKGYRVDLKCEDGKQFPTKDIISLKLCNKDCPGTQCVQKQVKNCVGCPSPSGSCGRNYSIHRERERKVTKYIYVKAIITPTDKMKNEYMKHSGNMDGKGTKWNPNDIYDGVYTLTKDTGIEKGGKWKPPRYVRIPNFIEELCEAEKKSDHPLATISFKNLKNNEMNGPRDYKGRWELTVKSANIEKQWLTKKPNLWNTKYLNRDWTIIRYPGGNISDISPLVNAELNNRQKISEYLSIPKKWIMNTGVNNIQDDVKTELSEKEISTDHETELIMVSIDTEDTFKKIKALIDCYGTPKQKLLII